MFKSAYILPRTKASSSHRTSHFPRISAHARRAARWTRHVVMALPVCQHVRHRARRVDVRECGTRAQAGFGRAQTLIVMAACRGHASCLPLPPASLPDGLPRAALRACPAWRWRAGHAAPGSAALTLDGERDGRVARRGSSTIGGRTGIVAKRDFLANAARRRDRSGFRHRIRTIPVVRSRGRILINPRSDNKARR